MITLIDILNDAIKSDEYLLHRIDHTINTSYSYSSSSYDSDLVRLSDQGGWIGTFELKDDAIYYYKRHNYIHTWKFVAYLADPDLYKKIERIIYD